jgi:alkanesulfonate monooxygenase SsuD/methylene tetrahydromethanopterin reductase-like flavin-dependent oxidoreductase (luciferase family)
MAIAADDSSLPQVRQLAERRFGGPGFGLKEGGLIGTPDLIVERLNQLQLLGFQQVVLFTHDRASDQTLDLLANNVIAEL